MRQIHGILDVPILIDVVALGCQAHHPRLWWTNMALAKLLQLAVSRIKRPNVYMSDIMDPH
jgi:hypothetical protein